MSYIDIKIQNNYAVLTLNRTDKFNAFIRPMSLELQEKLDECAQNKEVRAVLLTATGKAFCAGQDLGEAIDPNGPDIEKIVNEHYNPIVRRLRSIEKPVVCGVNGVAAGAGASLALACDIVIAKKSAVFIQAFSKIGLIPDSGATYTLPRLVGMQKAMALMMLADNITAEEAEQMNMIYKAVNDEHFEEEIHKITEKLANLPTVGLGLTKRLLNASWNNSLEEQLQMEAKLQAQAAQTHDFKEGVQAFLEKRKPEFKGK
ncbi:MAG: 2-(1,2-epoxy-1,2-dihydrophenyl)acetyl-CoA isomerase [Bacteroidetes bacterium]|nr:MAG: 2-(1,2-epoxy-1,2-dihydrophenyl)acetyl-CoA isomerase [Bacteroidota bacterium]